MKLGFIKEKQKIIIMLIKLKEKFMKKKLIILVIALSFSFTACKNTNEPIQVEKKYGSIKGYVLLEGHDGIPLPRLENIQVVIEELKDTTMTDSIGNWNFKDIEIGLYTISTGKDSFGIYKTFNVKVEDSKISTVGEIKLYKIPAFTIDTLTYKVIPGNKISFIGKARWSKDIPWHPESGTCFLIASKDSNISYFTNNYTKLFNDFSGFVIYSWPNFTAELSLDEIYSTDFKSGDNVYFLFYGYEYGRSYIDYKTNKTIYCSVNPKPSPKLMYKLP